MGSITQCRDDNLRSLMVRNAGFARHAASGFPDATISLSSAHGMALELSAENVTGLETLRRATRIGPGRLGGNLCPEGEPPMTRTKFARMRIYRRRKWKREGHRQIICWGPGWRILRLPRFPKKEG